MYHTLHFIARINFATRRKIKNKGFENVCNIRKHIPQQTFWVWDQTIKSPSFVFSKENNSVQLKDTYDTVNSITFEITIIFEQTTRLKLKKATVRATARLLLLLVSFFLLLVENNVV